MNCAWNELLRILPQRIRRDVDMLGREDLQEIRLRLNQHPRLIMTTKTTWLMDKVSAEDLKLIINAATAYSPWTADSIASGFFTAPGGHRIGLCGEAVVRHGKMSGIGTVRSVNIRIARDFPGIGKELSSITGSILIIGSPGAGKTTLLRDLIRIRGGREIVAVVDEREELFPSGAGFENDVGLDILSGCPKPEGIEAVLRNMGPSVIAVDEITAPQDCDALVQAGFCGVKLLCTAHAASRQDLMNRQIYRALIKSGLFDTLVILSPNKTFRTERMSL